MTPQLWIENSRYPSDHAFTRFHLVREKKLEQYPAVLLVHDRLGLTPFTTELAARLAGEGFLAFAVDLFTSAQERPSTAAKGEEFLRGHADHQIVRQLEQGYEYLRRRADVDLRRIGVVGLGTGGHYGFQWCLRNPDPKALVCVNAPYLVEEEGEAPLRAPFDCVQQLTVAALFLFGEKDPAVPAVLPERLGQELEKYRRPFHLKTYPLAGRGLEDPAEPGHDRDSAADAWSLIVKFLHQRFESAGAT